MTFSSGMTRRTAAQAVLLALLLVPTLSGGSAPPRDPARGQDDRFSPGPLEGMRFSRIPPGRFVMGSPAGERGRNDRGGVEEGPQHQVSMSGFEIMTTEVTQGMWLELMGATVEEQRDRADPEWDLYGVGPEYPIYYVSKFQAEAFADELNRRDPGRGYRLPTEAEWEYACRAGTTTRFFWGEDPDNSEMSEYGWIARTQEGTSYPVGQKTPNAWGLHDMLGNEFEWVDDWIAPYRAEAQTDPIGPATGTMGIIRGGDWYHDDQVARCAARGNSLPQNARYTSGFRLVREVGSQGGEGVEAVDYIRSSIETFPVVVLGEGGHQARAPHEFLRQLLGDPSVLAAVDVIVVEFANARHQATLDAYIAGEDVAFDSLSRVWRDTGASPIAPWDSPIYAELLEVIRDGNRGLPSRERARVIGGDPVVEWERIRTREDFMAAQTHRDPYVAELAMDLAFQRGKKVLILFGGVHLPRAAMGPGDPRNSITFRILEQHPGSVRAIEFLSPDRLGAEDRMSELVRGRVYPTDDHWAGELEAGGFFPGVYARVTDPETGEEGMRPITLYPEYRIKDLFDALIYVGPSHEWGRVPSFYDPVRDEAYLTELNRRSLLRFGRPFQSG